MLNYRRHIAFTSRIHSYITVLYVVVFFLFFLSMQLDANEALFNLTLNFSKAVGWAIVLLGFYIIAASIHISFSSRVLTFSPIILTILRLIVFIVFDFLLEFVARLTESGLDVSIPL